MSTPVDGKMKFRSVPIVKMLVVLCFAAIGAILGYHLAGAVSDSVKEERAKRLRPLSKAITPEPGDTLYILADRLRANKDLDSFVAEVVHRNPDLAPDPHAPLDPNEKVFVPDIPWSPYQVEREGQTLRTISKEKHVKLDDLQVLNVIPPDLPIDVGTEIKVPDKAKMEIQMPWIVEIADIIDTKMFGLSWLSYARLLAVCFAVAAMLAGGLVGSSVFRRLVVFTDSLQQMAAIDKLAVLVGAIVGGIFTLLTALFTLRIELVGPILTLLFGIGWVYLGILVVMSMKGLLRPLVKGSAEEEAGSTSGYKILDTNVIIDGRIADVCKAGFLDGTIYVPGFVLDELQMIADSADPLKRRRGRRGLEILNQMQRNMKLLVRSHDTLASDETEPVDVKLVRLAKDLGASIVTNDYNLNKVAALQGVKVLNVNELANAVKPIALPGEELRIRIVKEGKEHNQGVGFLDDGTMVVVENGKEHIGRTVEAVVTSHHQTVAGKMIFTDFAGVVDEGDAENSGGARPGRGPGKKI
jgi:uncharacterized protein YacL